MMISVKVSSKKEEEENDLPTQWNPHYNDHFADCVVCVDSMKDSIPR